MNIDLRGRTALVTGASTGIGRATALALADAGARVIGAARRTDLIDALAAETTDRTIPIASLPFDMARPGSAIRLAEAAEVLAEGRIDILVNCGGASRPVGLDEPNDVWADAMQIGFVAPRELSQALLVGMRKRGWGRIVSVTGTSEPQFLSASTPAKAALHVWSKGVSLLVARDGVTLNCIQPGRIRSEQIMRKFRSVADEKAYSEALPMGKLGEAEDVAAAIAFLASEQAGYISGTVVPVDGSFRRYAY